MEITRPKIIPKITGEVEISKKDIGEIKNISQYKTRVEEFLAAKVTELLEVILGGAIFLNSSDIHIESEEKKVKLRLRVDGVLHDVTTFDFKVYKTLLSRIKLLSKIKLNITDRPQDGRFTILMTGDGKVANERTSPSGREEIIIEIRASTLPAEYGEAIVLRLLNPKSLIEIEALGLRKDLVEIFLK